MTAAPLFAWPKRIDQPQVFGLVGAFIVIFIGFYGTASALSAYVPWRVHVDFAFEQTIPFVPAASIVYLSMNLLVGLAPFVLRDLRQILPLFVALCAQTILGALCYLVLPVETTFPSRLVSGPEAPFFALADLLNLERNYLPSLHVSFAVSAALAYGERVALVGKVLFAAWALAIAVSTVLIHEHHLLDVVAGVLLAWTTWRTLGAYARREAVLAAVDVELVCLGQVALFARRHLRYLLIWLVILRASLPGFRVRRVLRTGFCFLQAVDDLLDGDRASEREPIEVVDELIVALEQQHFASDALSRLARAFRTDLLASGGEPALRDAVSLMRVMQRDRMRALSRELLPAEDLRAHLRLTFGYSVDLMLIGAGAELRASDVPELIEALGWCSAVRDLEDDLRHGLVNIPREVVNAAQVDQRKSLPELLQTAAVRSWMHEERLRVLPMLDLTDQYLQTWQGRSGAAVLARFSHSIRRYTRKSLL